MRKLAGYLFIDFRGWTEGLAGLVALGALVALKENATVNAHLDEDTRSALYGSVASSTAALLGFVLAALTVLVALPSSERLEALKKHPQWPRVPSAFFRASRTLLAALVLSSSGIAVDNAPDAKKMFEGVVLLVVLWAILRVVAAVAALDQVLAVARHETKGPQVPNDP